MKKDRYILPSLFLFALIYLGLQVFPSIHVGDSPELIAAANILGNAHPPGYPLYIILGKIFIGFGTLLNLGSPALSLNLLQTIYAALALSTAYLLIKLQYSLSGQKKKINNDGTAAGIFSFLLILFCVVFIKEGTVAEVFMLNIFFISGILFSVSHKKYSLAGFLFGLAAGNQHTVLLVLPSVLAFLYFEDKRLKTAGKFIFWALGGLISVYIYMPLRAQASPPINWGNPSNLDKFLRVITRADYGTFSLHGSSSGLTFKKAGAIILYFFKRTSGIFTLPGAAVIIIGTILWFKNNFKFGLATVVLFTVSGPLFFLTANMYPDGAGISILERFFLIPAVAAGLLASGIFFLKNKAKFAVFLIPLFLGISNFIPTSDKYSVIDKYIRDIASELSAENKLYITRGGVGDDIVFGLAYLKYGENKLNDLKIYSQYGSIFNKPVPVSGRAAFATFNPENISVELSQSALLFKNYPADAPFPESVASEDIEKLDYRQLNIAINYPFFRARKYLTEGDTAAGLKLLEKTADIGKDIPWLLNNIGNLYMKAGRPRLAYESYLKAVEIDPDLAEGYNNIGNIFFNRRKWLTAVKYYQKAIDANPDPARYYNAGLAYLKSGNNSKAINYFKEALKIDAYYTKAYNDLGLAYYRNSEYEKAINTYIKGIRREPDNLNLIYNIALAYEQIKNYSLADRYWNLYIKKADKNDPARRKALWYLKN